MKIFPALWLAPPVAACTDDGPGGRGMCIERVPVCGATTRDDVCLPMEADRLVPFDTKSMARSVRPVTVWPRWWWYERERHRIGLLEHRWSVAASLGFSRLRQEKAYLTWLECVISGSFRDSRRSTGPTRVSCPSRVHLELDFSSDHLQLSGLTRMPMCYFLDARSCKLTA